MGNKNPMIYTDKHKKSSKYQMVLEKLYEHLEAMIDT